MGQGIGLHAAPPSSRATELASVAPEGVTPIMAGDGTVDRGGSSGSLACSRDPDVPASFSGGEQPSRSPRRIPSRRHKRLVAAPEPGRRWRKRRYPYRGGRVT